MDSRNAAVRRFRQGLARGLRSPDAVCSLHLLDARFDRAEFVKAIPARFVQAYRARFGTVEPRTWGAKAVGEPTTPMAFCCVVICTR